MNSQPKVVVVGSIIYDFRITADRLPRPGETLTGYGFGTSTGGKGANQAVAAVRLGADVQMVGRLGKDVFGDQVLEQFKKDGLGCEYVFRDPIKPTATCLIHVDKKGENDIIIAEGANAAVRCKDIDAACPALSKADVLIVQNEVPWEVSQYAMKIAESAGAITIYNPAPAKPLPEEILFNTAFFTPNETETEFYTGIRLNGDMERVGRAADILLDKGVRNVLITLGGKGSYFASKETKRIYPAFRITPVDTTAAGDAFNGGLAVMLGEGRPVGEAIRFANASGAVCAMRAGSQTAIGFRNEVEDLINKLGTEKHLYGTSV